MSFKLLMQKRLCRISSSVDLVIRVNIVLRSVDWFYGALPDAKSYGRPFGQVQALHLQAHRRNNARRYTHRMWIQDTCRTKEFGEGPGP